MFGIVLKSPKTLFLKILIIFLPIYAVAFFTNKMVYVLPILAVGVFLGNSIETDMKKGDYDEGEADFND